MTGPSPDKHLPTMPSPPSPPTQLIDRPPPADPAATVRPHADVSGRRSLDGRGGRLPLGIVHIPKSGGIAVRTALAQFADLHHDPPYFDEEMIAGLRLESLPLGARRNFASRATLKKLSARHSVMMGHFSGRNLIDAGCRSIAVQVREPRARLLSLYQFWRAHTPEEQAEWGVWGERTMGPSALPVEEFLRSAHVWPAIRDAMARQLLVRCTSPNPARVAQSTQRAVSGRHYDQVTARLAVAEWSSRAQRFLDRICKEVLDVAPVTVTRENVTPVDGRRQPLGAGGRAALVESTRLDSQLLDRLMADGHLDQRSPDELDGEFEQTAERLGFDLC